MDRITFEDRLRLATHHAVQFAREFVLQTLTDDVVYLVFPNQSYDGNFLADDEILYPDETLPSGQYRGPWTQSEVVAFLWRAEKVPEWIDIAVHAENGLQTVVSLRCCGRFTANEKYLYYRNGVVAPFGIKGPILPPEWESVEVSGKFDIALSPH